MGLSLSEHALDTGVHLLFLDELTSLRGRDSLLHGGKEPGFFIGGRQG
jgi:hypothetical protein